MPLKGRSRLEGLIRKENYEMEKYPIEGLIEKAEYKDLFIYGNRKHKNCILIYFVGSKKPKIISVRSIAKGMKTSNNAKRIAEYINKSNMGEPYKG